MVKKIFTKYIIWVIIAAMLIAMLPAVINRVSQEEKNDNITVSLLYNNLRNSISPEKLDEMLDRYLAEGINTVSVMEEDINSLVARGEVTSIKFNVLLHKYDKESMDIASAISENYPEVAYDSHLVLVKKEWAKQFLKEHIPSKYSDREYVRIDDVEGMDIYAFYNGREKLWDISLGYDEKVISYLYNKGFDISLIYTVRNYPNQLYLDYIDRLVGDYDIKFFNIKKASAEYKPEDEIEENYKGIADIIDKHGMTLVVTENTDQLSNQKTLGYSHIFNSVMNGGTGKLVRSYETYDDSQDDGSHYIYRANQYFNSTIDRNIRFITVTQIASSGISYDECAELTLKAVTEYMNRVRSEGFTVNKDIEPYDYSSPGRLPFACCAVIMIMLVVSALALMRDKHDIRITLAGVAVSVVAFALTFVLPQTIVSLYPSVYCVAVSCYAMTVLLRLTISTGNKGFFATLIIAVFAVLASICLGMLGMGAMLSGIDYYVNNLIFRGIKLSLLVPVFYTLVIYYVIYIKNEKSSFLLDVKKVMNANIRVYWLIIAVLVAAVGMYYIMRSGNVNKISSLELAMRNTITEAFPARPRTKEFLIGYPALVLFVYYVKKTDWKLVQWGCAVLSSILAASVTNSFCHVFTDLTTIYMRVVNGLVIGIFVSAAAYVANLLLVKLIKLLQNKLDTESEMK